MKLLRFYGNSDDTFGEYETFGDDYDCCANGEPIIWKVAAADGELYVIGQYLPDGSGSDCWMIGVQLAEEGGPLPLWRIRLEAEHHYSHALVIEAPDDVRIECLNREREKDDEDE